MALATIAALLACRTPPGTAGNSTPEAAPAPPVTAGPAPAEARLVQGGREAAPTDAAARADDLAAALASCAQRTRQLVAEADWDRARRHDFAWARWSPPLPIVAGGRAIEVTEILVPLDADDPFAGSVLARSTQALLSPFTACDAALLAALREDP